MGGMPSPASPPGPWGGGGGGRGLSPRVLNDVRPVPPHPDCFAIRPLPASGARLNKQRRPISRAQLESSSRRLRYFQVHRCSRIEAYDNHLPPNDGLVLRRPLIH